MEADGLAALAVAARGSGLRVPAPLALSGLESEAVLLLPWLALDAPGGSDAALAWRNLGAGLAALHRHSLERRCCGEDHPERFGWPRDNAIGAGEQVNGWCDAWGRFFAERRLAPQLERLQRREGAMPGAAALLDRVPQWLASHPAEPCLVHGDLWSGNAGLGPDGAGVIFDPAVYRGDREVDLAMARLFGGFPAAFFAGYEAAWPLAAGHRERVPLYNLYHLLNHANLFGGSYGQQARQLIGELLRQPPI